MVLRGGDRRGSRCLLLPLARPAAQLGEGSPRPRPPAHPLLVVGNAHSLVDVDEHTLVGIRIEPELCKQLRPLWCDDRVDGRYARHRQVAPVFIWIEVGPGEAGKRLVVRIVLV